MATKPKPAKSKATKYHVYTPITALQTARAPRDNLAVGNLTLNDADLSLALSALITSLELEETMDGASVLTIVVFDPSRVVLNSPLAATASTVVFDRVSYTLVGVEISDANLTLTFEETAVNVLRQQKGPVKANRYNTTRAQFIRSLVLQPKQYTIPFYAPEVNIKQPIAGGKADVLKEANWITPSGGVKRTKTPGQQASANQGGKGQGWITIYGTTFSGTPGSCGTLGDGHPHYAELGLGSSPFGPLLGPLFGFKGELPCGFALDVEYRGTVVRATKGDIGTGQPEAKYKMDVHTSLQAPLNFNFGNDALRIRKSAT
jgi:hypothetical protein